MTPSEADPSVLYAEVPDFYAEVERLSMVGRGDRPIIVGGDPAKRGKVQSASIEARVCGVRSGMPMRDALSLCPDAVCCRTDMRRYRRVHDELGVCLRRVADALEIVRLGAVYLDNRPVAGASEVWAERLVAAVRADLALPLRVGIGPSKLLALLVATATEGEGVHRVSAQEVESFLAPLAASRLPQVGKKAQAKLAELGATTIGEVVDLGPEILEREFGRRGLRILDAARGEDRAPVRVAHRPQSISRAETLAAPTREVEPIAACLERLAVVLERALMRQALGAHRIALKLRFADQSVTTRSVTLGEPIHEASAIHSGAVALLERASGQAAPVRALSLTVAGLVALGQRDRQLELFSPI